MGGISDKRAGGIVLLPVGVGGVGCGRGPKSSATARMKVNAGEGSPAVHLPMGRDRDMNLVERYWSRKGVNSSLGLMEVCSGPSSSTSGII